MKTRISSSCSSSKARKAGLSWDTILAKRARYREVYDGIDALDSLVRGCATGSNLGLQINDNGASCTLVENH